MERERAIAETPKLSARRAVFRGDDPPQELSSHNRVLKIVCPSRELNKTLEKVAGSSADSVWCPRGKVNKTPRTLVLARHGCWHGMSDRVARHAVPSPAGFSAIEPSAESRVPSLSSRQRSRSSRAWPLMQDGAGAARFSLLPSERETSLGPEGQGGDQGSRVSLALQRPEARTGHLGERLGARLRRLGIVARKGRTAALMHLAGRVPVPILRDQGPPTSTRAEGEIATLVV